MRQDPHGKVTKQNNKSCPNRATTNYTPYLKTFVTFVTLCESVHGVQWRLNGPNSYNEFHPGSPTQTARRRHFNYAGAQRVAQTVSGSADHITNRLPFSRACACYSGRKRSLNL